MDRIPSAGFEGIAQMLLEQKKLMDALEAENRELRRQLNDLRRGVGIALVIDGKTIPLAMDQSSPVPANAQGMQAGMQPNASQAMANGGYAVTMRQAGGQQRSDLPDERQGYAPTVRQVGGQQQLNPNNDRRDNGRPSSPLADSFVL